MTVPEIHARCEMAVLAEAAQAVALLVDRGPERFRNLGPEARRALLRLGSANWPSATKREAIATGYCTRKDLRAAVDRLLVAASSFADASAAQGQTAYRQAVRDAANDLGAFLRRYPPELVQDALNDTNRWYEASVDVLADPAVAAALGVVPPGAGWPMAGVVDWDGGAVVAAALSSAGSDADVEPEAVAQRLAAGAVSEQVLQEVERAHTAEVDMAPLTNGEIDALAVKAGRWHNLRDGG